MLEQLREEIADAIANAEFDQAEAVIRALGIKVECTVWLDQPQHRFVTDWRQGGWDHRNL